MKALVAVTAQTEGRAYICTPHGAFCSPARDCAIFERGQTPKLPSLLAQNGATSDKGFAGSGHERCREGDHRDEPSIVFQRQLRYEMLPAGRATACYVSAAVVTRGSQPEQTSVYPPLRVVAARWRLAPQSGLQHTWKSDRQARLLHSRCAVSSRSQRTCSIVDRPGRPKALTHHCVTSSRDSLRPERLIGRHARCVQQGPGPIFHCYKTVVSVQRTVSVREAASGTAGFLRHTA